VDYIFCRKFQYKIINSNYIFFLNSNFGIGNDHQLNWFHVGFDPSKHVRFFVYRPIITSLIANSSDSITMEESNLFYITLLWLNRDLGSEFVDFVLLKRPLAGMPMFRGVPIFSCLLWIISVDCSQCSQRDFPCFPLASPRFVHLMPRYNFCKIDRITYVYNVYSICCSVCEV